MFRAEAIDRDQRACSADLAEPCPCAELQYFLVDVDEVGVTVLVDAESGDVFLIGVVLPGKEFCKWKIVLQIIKKNYNS